jgi:hypothetical protein
MIKHELSQLRQRLQAIHAEMARLLPLWLARDPLLRASVRYQPRTCGNPGCRCFRGERHPAWVVQFSEGGRQRCRSVGREKFERLARPAQTYRRWRAARARWNRLVREANAVLGAIERGRTLDTERALEDPS